MEVKVSELALELPQEMFKDSGDGLKYTERLPLVGLSKDSSFSVLKRNFGGRSFMSTILFLKDEAVGHVDYSLNEEEALCSVKHINNLVRDEKLVPSYLRGFQSSFGYSANAFEIASGYRNQKLGGLLWAIGSLALRNEGVDEIKVSGDQTSDFQKGSGFYERYGGVKDKDGTIHVSTSLNKEQEKLITKAFGEHI